MWNIFVFYYHILGCLIKRQRIPLPGCDRNTGPFYRLLDLVVGGSVIFYGKEIRITGVDAFTRDFLVKMGIDVQDNEPIPDDPYFTYRKNVTISLFFFSKCSERFSRFRNHFDRCTFRVRKHRYEILIGRKKSLIFFFFYFADQLGLRADV